MEEAVESSVGEPAARPTLFGALRRDPAGALGFALATAGGFGLARLAGNLLLGVLGEKVRTLFGALLILVGGVRTPEDLIRVLDVMNRWSGVALAVVVGLLALGFSRATHSDLSRASRIARWLGFSGLFAAVGHVFLSAVTGRWSPSVFDSRVPSIVRDVALAASLSAMFVLLFWASGWARGALERRVLARGPRERRGAFLALVSVPVAAVALVPLPGDAFDVASRLFPTLALAAAFTILELLRLRSAPVEEAEGPVRPAAGLVTIGLFVASAIAGATWMPPAERPVGEGSGGASGPERPLVRAEPSYPRVDLVPGLLDEPVTLANPSAGRADFLVFAPDAAGNPALLFGKDGVFDALGPDLAPRSTLTIGAKPSLLEVVPRRDGSHDFLSILDARSTDGPYEKIARLDGRGKVRWEWRGEDRYFGSAAIAYDAMGPAGFVVGPGGAEGLRGLDLDGRPTWQIPKMHVVYELRTHPALPERFLFVNGQPFLYAVGVGAEEPADVDLGDAKKGPRLWVDHGRLFPSASGEAAFVVGGHTLMDKPQAPSLARFDAGVGEAWRATLPTKPEKLAMLEAGSVRLIVVTTSGGDLLIVDDAGTLRATARLPEASADKRTATYVLDAGRLGPDGWAIAVRLLHGTYVYRIHPERIPAR